ncbi:Holliday junction branch migration protein RuvA [Marinithermus hydrothermalis]|uniref:Holliday junction branch migration protein RuvA n=1 Tax=Marinithermus hydrothermalis TaxID=186192 RepID=UPI0002DF21C3|nr:Holliday junction branch migration protein RuvA [Marinithermus hydrothermalis]
MIRFLQGRLVDKREDRAVILTGGIGFEVWCPTPTLETLREGEEVALHTRLVVREDGFTLYGFHDPVYLELFDLLTSVSGVGPRVALGMLAALPPSLLGRAVAEGDAKALTAAPGVGKRLAERIVLELRHKIPAHLTAGGGAHRANPNAHEAIEALAALGFREAQVRTVVGTLAAQDPEAPVEELIRRALRQLR